MNVEVIAELGQGFEGKMLQAQLLVKAAAHAGANAAKCQLVYADELATQDYKYYNLFKSLEMPDEAWQELSNDAKKLGVELQFDIFGPRSLRLAEQLGANAIKLHGTDIVNIELLNLVARSGIARVLLGVGGAHESEILHALGILKGKRIVLILGFQGYPTLNEDNQITRVCWFVKRFCDHFQNVSIGFADHASPESAMSISLAVLAIGAGATVIEKHLTLGKLMLLEDYESALNPDEFFVFVGVVRACDQALGKSKEVEDYGMSDAETGYRKMIRRHVVTSREIKKGTVITPSDVLLKRSSLEGVVTDMSLVYGAVLNRNVEKNEPLRAVDLKKKYET